jgi:nucleoid DNA-binding protein
MNKKEMIEIVAYKHDITKKDAEEIVNSVFQQLTQTLLNDNKVVISGFGTFNTKKRKERNGTNPSTSELIKIPESKTIVFKPSTVLVDRLNQK